MRNNKHMTNTNIKHAATEGILVRLTFDGAFQRANIYRRNLQSFQKKKFRNSIALLLSKYLKQIRNRKKYKDEDHYETIVKFSKEVTGKHRQILRGKKMRIGNAQKFLNLYWKVCWLLKKGTSKPIHCPFDSIIMKKLPRKVRVSWTQFDTIEEYKTLVNAVQLKIGKNKSIADWELEIYQKAINYTK